MTDAASAEELRASEQITQMLGGFQLSQAIYVVAKLDLATELDAGPLSVTALAGRVGAQADPLMRVIRTLAGLGLFTVDGDLVGTTALGAALSRHHPRSTRATALYWLETHYRPFGELLHTVRTGEPAAERVLGRPFFDWIAADPDRAALQSAAMASMKSTWQAGIFDGYELPPGELIADLGGADGTLLARLLQSHPERRGIVFDLPQVVPAAERLIARRGLGDRITAVGGDFFDTVPAADLYLLSRTLHDWDDDACRRILARIAEHGAPDARVIVIEGIVPPENVPHVTKLIDLVMLALVSGRERTREEFEALLESAGFSLERVVPTSSPISILEARRLRSVAAAPASS